MQNRLSMAARFGLCVILSCATEGSNQTSPPGANGGGDAATSNGTGGGGMSPGSVDANGVPGDVPKTQLGTSLSVGPFASCIIDDQTNVHCFGRCGPAGQGGSRDVAPAGLKARSVAVGRVFACASLVAAEDGTVVRCWGGGPAAAAPKIADAAEIVAAGDHACARSALGAVTCWGAAQADAGALQLPPGDVVAKGLAASEAMDCAIGADDGIRCWGARPISPPADLKAKRIAVSTQLADPVGGPRYGCAITLGDDVRCWGDDPGGVQTVPQGLKAKEIAVGRSAGCVIALDGGITCWGTTPRFGVAPPQGPKATVLSMAFRTAGAVLDDHSFAFWGDVSDGRGAPPAGVRAP